jgi:hypothetical protein
MNKLASDMHKTIAIVQSNWWATVRRVAHPTWLSYVSIPSLNCKDYLKTIYRNRNMAHISIVTPVYKAEGCLHELYRRLKLSLETLTTDFEILMVEDCGGDHSWDLIKELAQQDVRVKGIQFSCNFGQHCGIKDWLEELYLGCQEQFLSAISYRFLTAICQMLGINTQLSWSMDYKEKVKRKDLLLLTYVHKQGQPNIFLGPPQKAIWMKNYLDRKISCCDTWTIQVIQNINNSFLLLTIL